MRVLALMLEKLLLRTNKCKPLESPTNSTNMSQIKLPPNTTFTLISDQKPPKVSYSLLSRLVQDLLILNPVIGSVCK